MLLDVPDGGVAAHLAFDLRGDAALLFGRVDFELVVGRRIVAAIAGISVEPFEGIADQLLDRRNDPSEGVAIIRIAGQRLRMSGKLSAVAMLTLTPNS